MTRLTVNVTFTATITCSVFAIPLPHITWINNTDDSIVVGGGTNRITITETDHTHIRVSVLNFTSTVKFDESMYTCMAVNNISNVLDTPETNAVFLRIQGTRIYMYYIYILTLSLSLSLFLLVLHFS